MDVSFVRSYMRGGRRKAAFILVFSPLFSLLESRIKKSKQEERERGGERRMSPGLLSDGRSRAGGQAKGEYVYWTAGWGKSVPPTLFWQMWRMGKRTGEWRKLSPLSLSISPTSERRWKNRRERETGVKGDKKQHFSPVCTLASCVLWIQDLELGREVSTEARTAANLNSCTASLLSPTYVRYLASNSRPPQCEISRDLFKHLHRAAAYCTSLHCRYKNGEG